MMTHWRCGVYAVLLSVVLAMAWVPSLLTVFNSRRDAVALDRAFERIANVAVLEWRNKENGVGVIEAPSVLHSFEEEMRQTSRAVVRNNKRRYGADRITLCRTNGDRVTITCFEDRVYGIGRSYCTMTFDPVAWLNEQSTCGTGTVRRSVPGGRWIGAE